MENEVGGYERGQWSPLFISLNGWADWDKKMETMMDSMAARKLVEGIIYESTNAWKSGHR